MKNKKYLFAVLILIIAAANFTVDRVTKIAAENDLRGHGTVKVVGEVFILHYAENDGAFLGMGGDLPEPFKTLLLVLFPVLLTGAALVYVVVSKNLTAGQVISLACIIGGGVGNLWDRIFNNGIVVDFMNFGIGNLRTGILNVADLSITFGAVAFILLQPKKVEEVQDASEQS